MPQPLRAAFGMRARVFDNVARNVVREHERSLYVALDFEPDPSAFAADGYHPSEESYAEFGRHMADRLLAVEARRPATSRP